MLTARRGVRYAGHLLLSHDNINKAMHEEGAKTSSRYLWSVVHMI
jgi:hypothetical protein